MLQSMSEDGQNSCGQMGHRYAFDITQDGAENFISTFALGSECSVLNCNFKLEVNAMF